MPGLHNYKGVNMRKFILIKEINGETFQPIVTIKQKHNDGSVSTLFTETLEWTPPSKYTKEQQEQIDSCNTILANKGMDALTEEEIEYMLDPSNMSKRLLELEKEMSNTETLQRMAGFRVEKKIIPLD
jgi:hypothetical protein